MSKPEDQAPVIETEPLVPEEDWFSIATRACLQLFKNTDMAALCAIRAQLDGQIKDLSYAGYSIQRFNPFTTKVKVKAPKPAIKAGASSSSAEGAKLTKKQRLLAKPNIDWRSLTIAAGTQTLKGVLSAHVGKEEEVMKTYIEKVKFNRSPPDFLQQVEKGIVTDFQSWFNLQKIELKKQLEKAEPIWSVDTTAEVGKAINELVPTEDADSALPPKQLQSKKRARLAKGDFELPDSFVTKKMKEVIKHNLTFTQATKTPVFIEREEA